MTTTRQVPKVGDRVRYVIEAEVTGYYGGQRILTLRADDGKRWTVPYDGRGLFDEDGVTLTVLEPAGVSPP